MVHKRTGSKKNLILNLCHLCCDICPSLPPLPFAASRAGLAHYYFGNFGRGEIVVILGSLLLKIED